MATSEVTWSAPAGFLTFRLEDVTVAWIDQTARELAGEEAQETFREALSSSVAWCRAQDDDVSSWYVLIDASVEGQPRILGAGSIDLGPAVDLHETVESWRSQLEEFDLDGEVRYVDSKRAPLALVRQVALEQLPDGRDRYIEEGRVVKLFPRYGVSGTITLITSNLLAVGDMLQFLQDASADFVIDEAVDA